MSSVSTSITASGVLFGVDVVLAADISKADGVAGLDWRVEVLPGATVDLTQSLTALAAELGLADDLPQALQLSAEIVDMVGVVTKPAKGPSAFEVAARFGLKIDSQTWTLDLGYTSSATFDGRPAMAGTAPAFVFALDIGGPVDFSRLPLIGSVPGIGDLSLQKLGFFYTNADFTSADKTLDFALPDLDPDHALSPTPVRATLDHSGFSFAALYGKTGEIAKTLGLPLATSKPAEPSKPGYAADPSVPQSPIKWINIGKTFGPVGLQKIGLGFSKPSDPGTQSGEIGVFVDGTFQVAGLGLALEELGLSFAMPKSKGGKAGFDPLKDISFHLGGLLVNYQTPDFQVSGGFVTLPGGSVDFVGEFIVNAGQFGLQAYGGFSNQLSSPSLFLFVHLEAPLGGPPYFFVTGLAGGFGVNRGFKLPGFAELTDYPLLPTSTAVPTGSQLGTDPQQQLERMTAALAGLARYIPVEEGEFWVAVGLDVTSFEMINVSAVLSVAFGVDFQIAVIGNANMSLPLPKADTAGVPPLSYISIDFEVSYTQSSGLIAAYGKLTPDSFIYASFVHLSGGFAFLTWVSGPNAGNFLVSIGGYNPHYAKPDIYPALPRLQMAFGVASLNVRGDAYFALTPGAMMAGFGLSATWSLGPIHANFDAGMDFLINWKPFHYQADGYIHLSVSLVIHVWFVHIRITIHIGADLNIWGPKFGGRAVIDLDIVSFTIHFGDPQTVVPATWQDVQQMLPSTDGAAAKPQTTAPVAMMAMVEPGPAPVAAAPATSAPSNVTISTTAALKIYTDQNRIDGLDWLLDPNTFSIDIHSSVPCTDAVISRAPHKGEKVTSDTVPIDLRTDVTATDYIPSAPDKMKDGVATEIKAGHQYPFFAYTPPAKGGTWADLSFGVAPVNVDAVQAVQNVALRRLDGQSNAPGAPVNDLIYVLTTGKVPASLWSTKGHGQADASLKATDQVIDNALTGFRILPAYFFPARTSFIEYYYLIFDQNDLFLYADVTAVETAPPVKAADYTQAERTEIDANMKSGVLFGATASGPFTGTAPARAAVVDILKSHGHAQLAPRQDTDLDTENYLDDPLFCFMSNTSETALGAAAPARNG